MAKRVNVFSVYCPDSETYPYFPFTAETIFDGVCKYMTFLASRDYICPNPQLHFIGYANIINGVMHSVEPLVFPQQVVVKDNPLTWSIIFLDHFREKIKSYIARIFNYEYYEKHYLKNERKFKNV